MRIATLLAFALTAAFVLAGYAPTQRAFAARRIRRPVRALPKRQATI